VALVLTAFPTLDAGPAHACSCIGATVPEHFDQADVVFVGELEANLPAPEAVRHQFDVERVFKGEAGAVADVLSTGSGASCGLSLDPGQTYAVFATQGGSLLPGRDYGPDVLVGSLCSGTRPMGVERAAVLFATGRPPSPDIAVPDDSQLALKQPLILAALAAAVLAGGVAVILRRGAAT